jgi:hypothetical protein
MHSHTFNALAKAILQDLRVSQSSADSTAQRLSVNAETVARICEELITAKQVETLMIADRIKVYRITPKGLETIS